MIIEVALHTYIAFGVICFIGGLNVGRAIWKR